ncbi:type 2 isopentenyl-diphosphate Delta-isomerase [Ignavibacterium sp.]|uniref:type 2 isopentenyl-diphosphate Delta-isomerase n=1 Tax=Ignavibacterium sp. TaxID=2651167 RepID=UPI0022028E29|nr:type 2 isopentenyl-diphosphate Delta-isomerase [Ignavibacterium sp.]BDQ02083.1 MAG: isopentenyl-diphosphate delta-isomerase [Ignavibacterium sp.]
MSESASNTSQRKSEHIRLCLTNEVSFRQKTNGFENYEFIHSAVTEVDINKISFQKKLFGKKINYPFLISCMTGGTTEAENINSMLAEVAEEIKIPIGVGSQRQALENAYFHNTYKVIRSKAKDVPVLGNIGAAQLVHLNVKEIQKLVDMLDADAFVVHLNPLQELLQPEGEPYFVGLLKKLESVCKKLSVPVIAKEVGSGIDKISAKKLLDVGVKGIDVAGAGGTSWAGVELIRKNEIENPFWDWGLPTAYCIRTVNELKKNYNFLLIGSGGINSASEMAKAFSLGADLTASARIVLQKLMSEGQEQVKLMIESWFKYLREVMFLTNSQKLSDLQKNKIQKKELLT